MIRPLIAAFLLGGAQEPSRLRDLVDRLKEDSIEAREKAAEEIVELGRAAVAYLEPLRRSEDAELRARVASILRSIELNETLRRFYRRGPRISLDLAGVPAAEALAELARRAGDSFRFDPADFREPVTLRLSEVPFWDALHELARAAPALAWTFEDDALRFERRPRPPYPARRQGEFSVWVDGIAFSREHDFTGVPRESFTVGLNVAWERGIAPAGLETRITEITDDRGQSLLAQDRGWVYPRLEAPKGRTRRDEFRYALPGGGDGIKRIARLAGVAAVSFPLAYEDAEIELGAGAPFLRLGDLTAAVRGFRPVKGAASFEVHLTYALGGREVQPDRLPGQGLVVIDDLGAEHRVTTTARTTAYGGQSFTVVVGVHVALPEARSAARLRLRLLKETLEKRSPFAFTDIRVD